MCLPPICVGAGLPANTVAVATVNGRWGLASRPGPFAGTRPYSGLCPTTDLCRSGFTREYGGGGNGERRVGIGQQVRPLRG
ncbi:EAL domain/GGDEF domain protein [Pseudomonas sp. XWY-1]|nr:EAL domain/GGDEF domain protein [Pseudomonas sp. XWY-1]